MKKFLLNLLLFCLPFILLFAFPVVIFTISGEFLPIKTIISHQQNDPTHSLYLSGIISATDRPYKFQTTVFKNPEIIVFGTSRTLTFKSDFFKNPAGFYNAGYNGGPTLKTQDLLTFINTVPKNSKLKIIMLDASSFLSSEASGKPVADDSFNVTEDFLTTSWRNIYADYFKGKFSLLEQLRTINTNPNIGLTAKLYDIGYRADGSLERNTKLDKSQLENNNQTDIAINLAQIVPGHGGFKDYSDSIPQENLDTINQFLLLCKQRNIYVLGYLSPYATELHQKMLSLQDGYGNSYRTAPVVLGKMFAANNFSFYDLRDLSTIGSSDEELYDAYHSTEKGTLKLLTYLDHHEPKLSPYLDATQLSKMIDVARY